MAAWYGKPETFVMIADRPLLIHHDCRYAGHACELGICRIRLRPCADSPEPRPRCIAHRATLAWRACPSAPIGTSTEGKVLARQALRPSPLDAGRIRPTT